MPLLSVEHLSVSFGSIRAVKDVSFQVNEGEIVTLLGANGAGKSTIMRTIVGLESPSSGTILYQEKDIGRQDTRGRVVDGITLVPEGRHVFPRFSVKDNLLLGAYTSKTGRTGKTIDTVYQLFPRLKEREEQPAGTLSGGEQQMLAVGRALMANPKLLLLDEPSLGLAPIVVRDILNLVKQIRDLGTTILLVEQNARSALRISDRGYVLETGKIALEGTARELLESPQVQKVYLGMYGHGGQDHGQYCHYRCRGHCQKAAYPGYSAGSQRNPIWLLQPHLGNDTGAGREIWCSCVSFGTGGFFGPQCAGGADLHTACRPCGACGAGPAGE